MPGYLDFRTIRSDFNGSNTEISTILAGDAGNLYIPTIDSISNQLSFQAINFPSLNFCSSILTATNPSQTLQNITAVPIQWVQENSVQNRDLEISGGIPLMFVNNLFASLNTTISTIIQSPLLWYSWELFNTLLQSFITLNSLTNSLLIFNNAVENGWNYGNAWPTINNTQDNAISYNFQAINASEIISQPNQIAYFNQSAVSWQLQWNSLLLNEIELMNLNDFSTISIEASIYLPQVGTTNLINQYSSQIFLPTDTLVDLNNINISVIIADTIWTAWSMNSFESISNIIDPLILIQFKLGNQILTQNWTQFECGDFVESLAEQQAFQLSSPGLFSSDQRNSK